MDLAGPIATLSANINERPSPSASAGSPYAYHVQTPPSCRPHLRPEVALCNYEVLSLLEVLRMVVRNRSHRRRAGRTSGTPNSKRKSTKPPRSRRHSQEEGLRHAGKGVHQHHPLDGSEETELLDLRQITLTSTPLGGSPRKEIYPRYRRFINEQEDPR
jgi:hypothetical protein